MSDHNSSDTRQPDPRAGEVRAIDPFDYAYGQLDGLPDAVRTGESIVREVSPLVGVTETFIVQTVRQSGVGDTIFLEVAGRGGLVRIVVPPKVAATIARQRDALSTLAARKNGRRLAAKRAVEGVAPPSFTAASRAKALATRRAKALAKRARRARRTVTRSGK